MLDLVGIEYEKIITGSETFVEKFFQEANPNHFPYTDFVLIGGDGLIHQVNNAIYHH